MKRKPRKRGNAPKRVCGKSSRTKKLPPSMARSLARWPNCASSDAAGSDLLRRESPEDPAHRRLDARLPGLGFAGSRALGLGRAPPDDGVRAGIHDLEGQRPLPVLA